MVIFNHGVCVLNLVLYWPGRCPPRRTFSPLLSLSPIHLSSFRFLSSPRRSIVLHNADRHAKDKKEFWGARRRAVGGKSVDDESGSDSEEGPEDDAEDDAAEMDELPDVGGGKQAVRLSDASLQPICYHALPRMVMDSLHHALWGMSTIDMTPGFGELCCDMVMNNVGYVGICHTDFQKQHIVNRLTREMFVEMKNSTAKVYTPAFANEYAAHAKNQKHPAPDDNKGTVPKKAKTEPAAEPPAAAPASNGAAGLNAALQKMLDAAKVPKPVA